MSMFSSILVKMFDGSETGSNIPSRFRQVTFFFDEVDHFVKDLFVWILCIILNHLDTI